MTLRIRHELAQLEQTHACFKDSVFGPKLCTLHRLDVKVNNTTNILREKKTYE